RGRLQPAGQQPPRPLEPGRGRRRPARADREAVGQQRRRGRRGPRRRRGGRRESRPASTAAEAAEVRDAAAAAGVTVLEGFHYLHHPVTRRLLELLDSGELGELRRGGGGGGRPPPPHGGPP